MKIRAVFTVLTLTTFLPALSQAREKNCIHSENMGHEIMERVYAAEKFRNGPLNEPYTDNLKALNLNKDGLPNECDLENWQITIKLIGKDKFEATIESKINKKYFKVNQDKKVSKN